MRLTHAQLGAVFPAFIRTTAAGAISDLGPSLKRVLPWVEMGAPFTSVFTLVRPLGAMQLPELARSGRAVTLRTLDRAFCLNGVVLEDEDGFLLLTSHAPDNMLKAAESGLTLADFSPADGAISALTLVGLQTALLEEARAAAVELAEARDIANAAVEETTERLSQAVAAYELGIIDYDTDSGATSFSARMERLLGLTGGQPNPMMRDLLRRMSPADAALLAQTTVDDIQSRRPQRKAEITIVRPDGETRSLQSMTRYFYKADGALERLVGIYMDVTEKVRDRAEVIERGKRLLELQAELAHTSRLSAMGEMAASLAHELNQPLTAISSSVGAVAMMLDRGSGPDLEGSRPRMMRAVRHVESQALRAGEIIRRLRNFIARGEADMQREDLGSLIDDALALALPNPLAAGAVVEKVVGPGAKAILADRVQIQQVLVNLIRNAVEAMKDQSTPRRLIITTRPATASMAVISVADTGPGIDDEAEAQLFSAFVSTKTEGMGVGLSICRRIIEGHGGQMWVERSEHGGADFRFTLPLLEGDRGVAALRASPMPAGQSAFHSDRTVQDRVAP